MYIIIKFVKSPLHKKVLLRVQNTKKEDHKVSQNHENRNKA